MGDSVSCYSRQDSFTFLSTRFFGNAKSVQLLVKHSQVATLNFIEDLNICVNGDAAESFRVNLWLKWSLFFSINESVSYLYRSAAEPAMCNHHLGLLFHMRFAGDLQALTAARCTG